MNRIHQYWRSTYTFWLTDHLSGSAINFHSPIRYQSAASWYLFLPFHWCNWNLPYWLSWCLSYWILRYSTSTFTRTFPRWVKSSCISVRILPRPRNMKWAYFFDFSAITECLEPKLGIHCSLWILNYSNSNLCFLVWIYTMTTLDSWEIIDTDWYWPSSIDAIGTRISDYRVAFAFQWGVVQYLGDLLVPYRILWFIFTIHHFWRFVGVPHRYRASTENSISCWCSYAKFHWFPHNTLLPLYQLNINWCFPNLNQSQSLPLFSLHK